MLTIRPFRNSDPPAISEVWCSQPPNRGLVQPMTTNLFDRVVLSKPYFDRFGLLVLEQDGHPVGFVHVGHGSNSAGDRIDNQTGVVCAIMSMPHPDQDQILDDLLSAGETRLIEAGASQILAGGQPDAAPFYFGLIGGSERSGVLESDEKLIALYDRRGYDKTSSFAVMQRQLAGFRPAVDRHQMQLRRKLNVEASYEPDCASWWEACKTADANRMQYAAVPRSGGPPVACAVTWDIEPLASCWGVHAIGILRLDLTEEEGQQQQAIFLLGEALRQAQARGVTLAEVHVSEEDDTRLELYQRLGFKQVDRGHQWSRQT